MVGLRLFCRILGCAAILGASASLLIPLALFVLDRSSQRITCGTAIHAVVTRAAAEDAINHEQYQTRGLGFAESHYVDQCEHVVAEKRSVAAEVAAVGAVLVMSTLYHPRKRLVAGPDAHGRRLGPGHRTVERHPLLLVSAAPD